MVISNLIVFNKFTKSRNTLGLIGYHIVFKLLSPSLNYSILSIEKVVVFYVYNLRFIFFDETSTIYRLGLLLNFSKIAGNIG